MNKLFARETFSRLRKTKPSETVGDEQPSEEKTSADKGRELVPTHAGEGGLNVQMAAVSTQAACEEMGSALRSKGCTQLSAEYRRGDGRRRQ